MLITQKNTKVLRNISGTSLLLWNKKIVFAGMIPAILIYLVLAVIPSLTTVILSFTDITGIPGISWHFIGLDNYKEFFFLKNSRDTIEVLGRTGIFAISVTLIQNSLAILVAVLLNSKLIKYRNLARAVVFLPTILGVTIVCFAWSFFFTLDGPADMIYKLLGIKSSGFLGSSSQAFIIVIFVQIWQSLGYAMIIYIAGLQGIPTELYEAAAIDGANGRRAFFKITIPLIWPTITVNVLLSMIGSLGVVQTILLLTGGDNNTSTLAMLIFSEAFGIGKAAGTIKGMTMRQGYAASQAMILFLMVFTVTILSQYIMRRKERDFE